MLSGGGLVLCGGRIATWADKWDSRIQLPDGAIHGPGWACATYNRAGFFDAAANPPACVFDRDAGTASFGYSESDTCDAWAEGVTRSGGFPYRNRGRCLVGGRCDFGDFDTPSFRCEASVPQYENEQCAEFWQAWVKTRPAAGFCDPQGRCSGACDIGEPGLGLPDRDPRVCVLNPKSPEVPSSIPFCSQ